MKEFCNLKSIDKEGIRKRWSETVSKLFKYAIVAEKKSVKTLLRQYSALDSEDEGKVFSLKNVAVMQH